MLLFSSLSGHIVRGDRCLKDYGFRLSQARVDSAELVRNGFANFILLFCSVSIRTGKYAGGTKRYFSFVRIWLVSTNKSITRGKYGHFNWRQMLSYSRLYQVTLS